MKKVGRIVLLLSVGVVLGVPLAVGDLFYGNPLRSLMMENATQEHLLELGYSSGELLEVKAFYSMKKDAGIKRTRAYVIFRDEPQEKYVYVQRKSGEVRQGCSCFSEDTDAFESEYTEKRKHMVKGCTITIFS